MMKETKQDEEKKRSVVGRFWNGLSIVSTQVIAEIVPLSAHSVPPWDDLNSDKLQDSVKDAVKNAVKEAVREVFEDAEPQEVSKD